MSKRILIISDSIFRQTGYSTVTNNIIEHLSKDFEVAQMGLAHMPVPNYNNTSIDYYTPIMSHSKCCGKELLIEHYNSKTGKVEYITPNVDLDVIQNECNRGYPNQSDPFGFESAYYIIEHFRPDIVIPINDIWGIYKLNFLKNRKNFKLVPYLAIDSECFPAQIQTNENINTLQFLKITDKLVVFTNWAKHTINKTSELIIGTKFNNIEIIPHGVNASKFFNLNARDRLIHELFRLDPNKVFIIGSVNRNQPRKRLDAIFQILKILKNKYEKPNGKKFMVHFHCAIKDSHGWDLPWLAKYYGVEDRVILDQNLKPGIGVTDELLNMIMNTYDVHLVPTNSEGWGLSILETMAVGIPNVISDYSAHGDWAKDYSLKIKLAAKIHEPITNHIKGIIDVNHAAKQISLLYNSKKMLESYKNKSIKLANKLQWVNVVEQWNILLNNIDISDLKENRYHEGYFDVYNLKHVPENPITTEFELQEI